MQAQVEKLEFLPYGPRLYKKRARDLASTAVVVKLTFTTLSANEVDTSRQRFRNVLWVTHHVHDRDSCGMKLRTKRIKELQRHPSAD